MGYVVVCSVTDLVAVVVLVFRLVVDAAFVFWFCYVF